MCFTYILYSNTLKKFYTGQTENMERRLEEHNRGKSSFSAKGIPWEIKFTKILATRSEAMKLEKIIKKRGAERFLNDLGIEVGNVSRCGVIVVTQGVITPTKLKRDSEMSPFFVIKIYNLCIRHIFMDSGLILILYLFNNYNFFSSNKLPISESVNKNLFIAASL